MKTNKEIILYAFFLITIASCKIQKVYNGLLIVPLNINQNSLFLENKSTSFIDTIVNVNRAHPFVNLDSMNINVYEVLLTGNLFLKNFDSIISEKDIVYYYIHCKDCKFKTIREENYERKGKNEITMVFNNNTFTYLTYSLTDTVLIITGDKFR